MRAVQINSLSRSVLAGVLICFFLSGAAGLVYQVAWGKALGLVFGNTVYAIATILAVFMGGLALGSAYIGKWSERYPNRVRLYAWMELIIAAAGAVSLLGLAGVRQLYLAAYPLAQGSNVSLLGLRFIGAAIVLLLPTFLMGGTLPVLVSGLTRSSSELGARVSRLYWVNTLGAVAGTFGAGFWLLPTLGLKLTVGVAVALNVVAGVIALWLARSAATPSETAPAEIANAAADKTESPAAPVKSPVFLLIGFAVVGGTAIAYEICWTRLLATTLGSSTYAFTLMLGTFLTGIVLGSMLFEILDRRWTAQGKRLTLGTFAATQTLTALAVLLFLVIFLKLPEVAPMILRRTQESFGGLILTQFAVSALAMLPAAIVFGFNFPVVTVLIAGRPESSGHTAAAVGRAYAANTLGAIIGATLTGFFLVPLVGSYRLVALMACVNLWLAAMLALRNTEVPQSKAVMSTVLNFALILAVATAGWSGVFYDKSIATFGTVLYWDRYEESHLTIPEIAATTDVIYAKDGLNATISVARTENYLAIRTNGKVDASNRDRITQLLVGHLGVIFHPAPRRVLIVGFGSGMTVAAVARHPEVEHIDCVEIEPGVIQAAEYLKTLNDGVHRDPRVHIILDDARNFLLTTRQKYDLIISEPSNPWIAGVASLFTDEFYRETRARLNPDGIFVQWVQAYSLFPEDFRMVISTFVPHYPQVTLWRGEPPDYILIAQNRAAPLKLDRLREMWPNAALRADFDSLGMRKPEAVLAFHRLDDADLRKLADSPERNTDDRTLLEYRAPRALLAESLEDKNNEAVWKHRTTDLSQILRAPDPVYARIASAHALITLDDDDAYYFLDGLRNAPESADLELARGRYRLREKQYASAKEAFQAALRLDASLLEAAWGIGEAARQIGDLPTAELMFMQVLGRDPNHLPSLRSLMRVGRSRGKWAQAVEWQTRLVKALPKPDAEEYARLGEVLQAAEQPDAALKAFLISLELDAYGYAARRNLADIFKTRKKWTEAAEQFEFIVRYHPDIDPLTYPALAEVYRELGNRAASVEVLRKGARIFPDSKEIQRLLPAAN
jgi:spermidine synthase